MSPVVKYLGDQNPFIGDPEGDADVESDCEGDSSEVTNGFSKIEGREEVLLRAVLTVGSLSACVYSHLSIRFLSLPRFDQNDELSSWKSLFFYCCTDEISFAPLRSQGVESRSDYIRENTVAAAPLPCSPKSIYVLANLVRRPPAGSRSWP